MKTVKLTEILDYYDGIQLFAAKDPIGSNYVCNTLWGTFPAASCSNH